MKLLKFSAVWCASCKSIEPKIKQIIESGATVESIDINENQELAKKYSVRSLPTMIVVDENGEEIKRFVGSTSNFSEISELLK